MRTKLRKSTHELFDADTIVVTLPNGAEFRVYCYRSNLDNTPVVQIDTEGNNPDVGRIRVNINDGAVWDGDPDTDPVPGAHWRRNGP